MVRSAINAVAEDAKCGFETARIAALQSAQVLGVELVQAGGARSARR
jgi:hypothetical protein